MDANDILDEIISGLQPEDVTAEFIVMAKIVDVYGVEKILRGEELRKFLENPDRPEMTEARVILDVRKIKTAILREVNAFFDTLRVRGIGFDGGGE
jgi:hypothetical protein